MYIMNAPRFILWYHLYGNIFRFLAKKGWMMKMLTLKNVSCEADFEMMCNIESHICKEGAAASWQVHPGGLCYDRYLFGSGAMDVFEYGKLLYVQDALAGYLLAYREEGEFVLRLLPEYEACLDEAVKLVVGCFDDQEECAVIANSAHSKYCEALVRQGFAKEAEERYQAVLALDSREFLEPGEGPEKIAPLCEKDFPQRIAHAAIPSDSQVTEEMFSTYLASPAYKTALELVARDRHTDAFMGFATWWLDEPSKTALLEPVACLKEYRRQGIARRLLIHGLRQLKAKGIRHAFVSTSADHMEAIPLYESLGFAKTGEANLYVKQK